MENILLKNRSSLLVLLSVIGWVIALAFVLTALLFWQQNKELRDLLLENNKLQIQLTGEKEQLMRRLSNEALIIDEKTEPYTFKDFGLYSPLFENQNVQTMTYDYKGNTITQKQITPSENDISPWSISVWEVLPPNDFQHLNSIKYGNTRNFPIFDGNEFQLTNPQFIEDRMELWNEKEVFVNVNNLWMNPGFYGYPRSIGRVKYEFVNQFSPSGNPSFVVVRKNIEDYTQQSYEAPVVNARKKLNEIVNTIDIRLPDDRQDEVTQ